MFGILALFGDAGAAIGPWLAGAVANVASSTQSSLGDLLPHSSSVGLRIGLLVGTIFPVGIALTTLAYGIVEQRRTREAQATTS